MQGESLRLRLGQLKKASIQLKSKVLQQHKVDYQAVSEILTTILPQKYQDHNMNKGTLLTVNDSALPKSPKTSSNNMISLSSGVSLNYSPLSSYFALPPPSPPNHVNKSAPDKIPARERSSSHDSYVSRDGVDSQIERLKKQNQELQTQISAISQDLNNLRKKEKVLEEESWKQNLPFLHRKENIKVFLTKLFIKEYDFDKIDYQPAKVEILHDKLIVELSSKTIKEYKLISLVDVKYLGDRCLKLDFKNDQVNFVFLQLQNDHQKDDWDLCLFVNQKIISNKELDKTLFEQVKIKQKQREQTMFSANFSIKSKSKSSLKFSDLKSQDMFMQSKGVELRSDKIRKNSIKGSKSSDKRGDKSNTSKGSYQNKNNQSSRYTNQLEYTLNGLNNDDGENPNNKDNQISNLQSNKQEKELMVFDQIGQSHNESRAHTSKFNLMDPAFSGEDQEPGQVPDTSNTPITTSTLISNLKIQEEEQIRRWQNVVSRLKGGYYFTKYAKDGFKPHNKHIYLSEDQQLLFSESTENSNQKKQIFIVNIKKVSYPAIDEGIQKHVKNILAENYCVIQYSLKGIDKLMELGCHKTKFIARFVSDLREFLKKKGIILNQND